MGARGLLSGIAVSLSSLLSRSCSLQCLIPLEPSSFGSAKFELAIQLKHGARPQALDEAPRFGVA
eukprot:12073872-Alexandrium_andersonii.AAC.1